MTMIAEPTIDPAQGRPRTPAARMVFRALLLRCPRCGGGGIWRSWFKMRHACPNCGLVLERGESEDYWLGAYMFNLVAAEIISVAVAVLLIVASWPDVAWNFVWGISIILALLMPMLFLPFARDIWLAFDLIFRHHEEGDVHQSAPPMDS